MNYFHFPVSYGTVLVYWNSQGLLSRIEWSANRLALFQCVKIPNHLTTIIDQIRGYFYEGEPLGPIRWEMLDRQDWSTFQTKVYSVISTIPHGETRTYGWVARQLGQASASRAVGQALRKNPLPILIPCHRVFACHSTGGFMGEVDPCQPELQLKRKLTVLEAEYCSPLFPFLTPSVALIG